MILYSSDTKFIGVSADILSTLGYEDMNTFMAYNNDIADLFVNRQGYVHKFENFSWINYVLNGSLPNKNVIIKTRSGGEIESSILITEIFLANVKEDSKDEKYYLVTLNNLKYIKEGDTNGKEDLQDIYSANKQPIFKIKDNQPQASKAEPQSDKPIDVINAEENAKKVEKKGSQSENEDVNSAEAQALIKHIFIEDEKEITVTKTSNVKSAASAAKPADTEAAQDKIIIDTQEVADLLGIAQSYVIGYAKEYDLYLDRRVGELRELYKNPESNNAQIKKVVIKLIGIGTNLRVKPLVQALQKLLSVHADNSIAALHEVEAAAALFKQSALKL